MLEPRRKPGQAQWAGSNNKAFTAVRRQTRVPRQRYHLPLGSIALIWIPG